MANDQRLRLFKALDNAGFNIGSYDDFDRRMNNAEDREKFYNAVDNAGFNIGNRDDFEKRITPSKYSLTINGKITPVSERQYKDFSSRHPKQQKPQSSTEAKAYEVGKANWGGVTDEVEAPASIARPTDTYSTPGAIQRVAEQNRKENYGQKVVDNVVTATRQEEERRNQPVVQTGNEGVDTYLMKTQGQLEDEIAGNLSGYQSQVQEFTQGVLKQKGEEMAADLQSRLGAETPIPGDEFGALFNAISGVNKDKKYSDKEKSDAIYNITKEWFGKDETVNRIAEEADKLGMDREAYAQYVANYLKEQVPNILHDEQLKAALPKSLGDDLARGFMESVTGGLYKRAVMSREQRDMYNEAEAVTAEGANPYYNRGTVTDIVRFGEGLMADALTFKGAGAVANVAVRGLTAGYNALRGTGLAVKMFGKAAPTVGEIVSSYGGETAGKILSFLGANSSKGQTFFRSVIPSTIQSSITLGLYDNMRYNVDQMPDVIADGMAKGKSFGEIAGEVIAGEGESFAGGAKTGAMFGFTAGASRVLGSRIGITGLERTWGARVLHGAEKAAWKLGSFTVEAGIFAGPEMYNKWQEGKDVNVIAEMGKGAGMAIMSKINGFAEGGVRRALTPRETAARRTRIQQAHDWLVGHFVAEDSGLNAKGQNIRFTKEEKEQFLRSTTGRNLVEKIGELARPEITDYDPEGMRQLTALDEFFEDKTIPWNVRAKVMAGLGDAIPMSRPRMERTEVVKAENSWVLREFGKDNELLSEKTYKSEVDADTEAYSMDARQLSGDARQYYNDSFLLTEREQGDAFAEFVTNEGIQLGVNDATFWSEINDPKSETSKRWREHVKASMRAKAEQSMQFMADWERDNAKPGTIRELLKKDPEKLSYDEVELLRKLRRDFSNYVYKPGELHIEQAETEGRQDAVDAINKGEVDDAKLAEIQARYNAAVEGFDALAETDKELYDDIVGRMNSVDDGNTWEEILSYAESVYQRERLAPVYEYMNAMAKYDSFRVMAAGEMELWADRESNRRTFMGTVNGEHQMDNMVVITDGEHTYTLVAGKINVGEDGKVLGTEDGTGAMIALDENGDLRPLSASREYTISQGDSIAEYRQRILTEKQEEVTAKLGLEEPAATERPAEEAPAEKPAEEAPVEEAPAAEKPAEEAPAAEKPAEEAAAMPQQTEQPAAEEPAAEQQGAIPTDENGVKQYHLVNEQTAIQDILNTPESKFIKGMNDPFAVSQRMIAALREQANALGTKELKKRYEKQSFTAEEIADVTKWENDPSYEPQTEMGQYLKALEDVNSQIKYYEHLSAVYTAQRAREFAEARAASEAEDQRRAQEKEETKTPSQIAAEEQAAFEENRKRYQAGRVEGKRTFIYTADGEKIYGHYVLHDASDVAASHNSENFEQTAGVPKRADGTTMNDNDYKNNKHAQQTAMKMGADYDGRALDELPVVTEDGVVISGNNRTISRQIAARGGTDAKYLADLRERAEDFGFTEEQLAGKEHPTVSFEPEGKMDYTTETYAKFNKIKSKQKSETEQSVVYSKRLAENRKATVSICQEINRFDTLNDFYGNAEAQSNVIKALVENGIWTENELALYQDKDGGLTRKGEIEFENLIRGVAFGEETIRVLDSRDMRAVNQTVLRAIPAIVTNGGLQEYSLQRNIEAAIKTVYEAITRKGYKNGSILDYFLQNESIQKALEATDESGQPLYSPEDKAIIVVMADLLSKAKGNFNAGSVKFLQDFLENYNNQASQHVKSNNGPGFSFEEAELATPDKDQIIKHFIENGRKESILTDELRRAIEVVAPEFFGKTKPTGADVKGTEGDGGEVRREEVDRKALEPRDDAERQIISDVEKKLADEIAEQEQKVNEAKQKWDDALAKKSEGADIFGGDDATTEKGSMFTNSEMGYDASEENVRRSVKSFEDAYNAEKQKLDALKDPKERDSRVRAALEEHRNQTRIEFGDDGQTNGKRAFDFDSIEGLQNAPRSVRATISDYAVAAYLDAELEAPLFQFGVPEDQQQRMTYERFLEKFNERAGALAKGCEPYLREVYDYIEKTLDKEQKRKRADKAPAQKPAEETPEQKAAKAKEERNKKFQTAKKSYLDDSDKDSFGRELNDVTDSEQIGEWKKEIEAEYESADDVTKEKLEEMYDLLEDREQSIADEEYAAREKQMLEDTPLTDAEIDSYDDPTGAVKAAARQWLNGVKNDLTKASYLEIYEHVRNHESDGARDSADGNAAHMDGGVDDGVRPGRGGGETGQLDQPVGEGAESKPSGEQDGTDRPSSPHGEGGNRPVAAGKPSAESNDIPKGRGRSGRGSAGSNGNHGERPGASDSGARPDGRDTGGKSKPTVAEATAALDDVLKELMDGFGFGDESRVIRPPFSRDGKGVHYALGDNRPKRLGAAEKAALMKKVAVASGTLARSIFDAGVHKIQQVIKTLKDKLEKPLRKIGYSDADLDRFIDSVLDVDWERDGEVHTVRQWLTIADQADVRKALSRSLDEKRKLQKDAEKVEVKIGDEQNISETLPFLLPEQQNDVYKTEVQFFDPKHQDDEHGNGKGMLFTNGTGTGKTYTGLGIAKRFIKQGKGRILIITPTQEKVTDWSEDAKNLGIKLTPLEKNKNKTATQVKGEGAVVTTYANFRQNKALLEDDFDLVIYDESHRLMESKDAKSTAALQAHYRITNKDLASALDRLTSSHPLWLREDALLAEKAEYAGKDYWTLTDEDQTRLSEIENELEDIEKQKPKVIAELTPRAKEAVGKTKTVFLSATPFNTRQNIEYAEGYLFSYGKVEGENLSPEEYASQKMRNKAKFFTDWFGAGSEIKNGKIKDRVSDEDAVTRQEIAFAEHLMNDLGTMSGRVINNGYDYSRDFPITNVRMSNEFNDALRHLTQSAEYSELAKFANSVFGDYQTMSVLYETMKVSAAKERIQQHLDMGRKVVIFHRRVSDNKGLAAPPFERVLNEAESFAAQLFAAGDSRSVSTAQAIMDQIALFKQQNAALLQWEQTLDYRMPRAQLRSLFGDAHEWTPDELSEYNHAISEHFKIFDEDKISGVSEEEAYKAGYEVGKRCFDLDDVDVVDDYKPHQEDDESDSHYKKRKAAFDKVAKQAKKGLEDAVRERIKNGEIEGPELDESGKKVKHVGLFAGEDSKNAKHEDVVEFNKGEKMNIIVVQEASGKEGISLHDQDGKHPRVMINLALPQSPISFIQAEGRIYRIGNKSNAIFEYPLLGIDNEVGLFAQYFNGRAGTTENLALGEMARGLKQSITRGILQRSGTIPLASQGVGGKEFDARSVNRATGYDNAIKDYNDERMAQSSMAGFAEDTTPEPLGYKMVEWAEMKEGESALEPSAGMGSISRYIPSNVRSLSIEPDQKRYTRLLLGTGAVERGSANAQGRRTLATNEPFENLNGINKYDTILMNPPTGEDGQMALDHFAKALVHLNNSGRLIAILPDTQKVADFVQDTVDGNPSYFKTSEVYLPTVAFSGKPYKIVVIDKVDRKEMRDKVPAAEAIDLRSANTMEEFFGKLRDVKLPNRTFDPAAAYMRHGENAKTSIGAKNPIFGNKQSLYVTERGVRFSIPNSVYNKQSYSGWRNPRDGRKYYWMQGTFLDYDEIKKLTQETLDHYQRYSDFLQLSDEEMEKIFSYAATNKRADFINGAKAYAKAVMKLIRDVSGRTDDQLKRAFKGEDLNNPYPVKRGAKFKTKDLRALFEANNQGHEERQVLFDKVMDVAEQLGMETGVIDDPNTNVAGYYQYDNTLTFNAAHWNAKQVYDMETGRVVTNDGKQRSVTLLHELIHAVTVYADWCYDHNPGLLTPELSAAVEDMRELHRMANNVRLSRLPGTYFLSNHKEFFSEMANDAVRDVMQHTQLWVIENPNGEKRYIAGDALDPDTAADLGAKATSLYNEMDKALDKVLANYNKDAYEYFTKRHGGEMRENAYGVHYKMGDPAETFEERQRKAVRENGVVMPDLDKAEVTVVKDIPRHSYTGSIEQATEQAISAAKKKYAPDGKPKVLDYNNFGTSFKYSISGNAIEISLSPKHQAKSVNKGVHLALAEHLDEVINESIEVEEHPDVLKDENGNRTLESSKINDLALMHRFYGVAEIDGKPYSVMTLMREEKNSAVGNGVHTYEVQKIEVLDEETPNTSNGVGSQNTKRSSYPVAKLIKDVEKSYDKGKNILEESKKVSQKANSQPSEGEIDGIHYKTGDSGIENPNTIARVHRHAEKVAKGLGVENDVKIHDDVSDIANPRVRADIEAGKPVMGWFDEVDGSVHLYTPNISNKYDAEATIRHEHIGHKGMRGLMGEQGFRDYMHSLWYGEDAALHDYVSQHLAENNFDLYDTIEEFLSEAAEKKSLPLDVWFKVRNAMTNVMEKAGFSYEPSIADVKYMVWLSKNRIQGGDPLSEARRNAMRWRLAQERSSMFTNDDGTSYLATGKSGKQQGGDGVHYATGSAPAPSTPRGLQAKAQYHRELDKTSYVWTEAYVDYAVGLKKAMEAIAGTDIMNIKDSENAYLAENQMSSVVQQREFQFNRDHWEPLNKAVNEMLPDFSDNPKVALEKLEEYMRTKHGLERNREFFVRDWLENKRAEEKAAQNNNATTAGQTADDIEARWDDLKTDAQSRLRSGAINFKEYLDELTDFIVSEVDDSFNPDKQDRSGLVQYMPKGKGEIDDAGLSDEVMSVERKLGRKADDFWDKVNGVTKYGVNADYESGIISKENKEHVDKMFAWYVPLRGFSEEVANEVYDYVGIPAANPVSSKTIVKAKGRGSESESPLAVMAQMSVSAISRGVRNEVKQRLLRFVRNHTNPKDKNNLISESSVWLEKVVVGGKVTWEERYPQIKDDATPDEVAQAVEDFNTDMKAKAAAGEARRLVSGLRIPYKTLSPKEKAQHIVEVNVNGEKHLLIVNGNPRAAQAMNGLMNPESSSQTIDKVNRFMSSAFTTWNPSFVASNTIRDAIMSRNVLATKENGKYVAQYVKNWHRYMWGKGFTTGTLWRKYHNGTLDVSKEDERYFKEFMENGGETGFVAEKNVEKWKKEIMESAEHSMGTLGRAADKVGSAVRAGSEKVIGTKAAEALAKYVMKNPFKFVEDFNERAENMARFATYMTSRQMGRGVVRSIQDAKDVSVNFNRKGAGAKAVGNAEQWSKNWWIGKSAQWGRGAYLFFNAGCQSLALLGRNIKNHPIKTATFQLGQFFLLGLAQNSINQMLQALYGDDDTAENAYANLPEWTRRNNICIFAGHNNFVKIPLPIELRAFYGLGDVAAGYLDDERLKSTNGLFVDMMSQVSQLFPVDYMGEGGSPGVAFMPDLVKPLWHIHDNRDWTGKPIQREETRWNKYDPGYTKAFRGENQFAVNISKKVNELTGGDDVSQGWLERAPKPISTIALPITNPAYGVELIDGYAGGMGKTFIEVGGIIGNIMKSDWNDFNTRNVPIAKALFQQADERTAFYRTRARYFKYGEEFEQLDHDLKGYKKGMEDPLHASKLLQLGQSRKARQMAVHNEFEKRLKKLRKARNTATAPEQVKLLDLQENQLMEQAVKAIEGME